MGAEQDDRSPPPKRRSNRISNILQRENFFSGGETKARKTMPQPGGSRVLRKDDLHDRRSVGHIIYPLAEKEGSTARTTLLTRRSSLRNEKGRGKEIFCWTTPPANYLFLASSSLSFFPSDIFAPPLFFGDCSTRFSFGLEPSVGWPFSCSRCHRLCPSF